MKKGTTERRKMGKLHQLNDQLKGNCSRFRQIVQDEFNKSSTMISEYVNSFKDPVWVYYVWYTGKGVNLQTASIIQLELPQEAKLEYKIEKLLRWDLKPEQDLMVIQVLNKEIDFDEQYCICKASDLVRLEKSKDIEFVEVVDDALFNRLIVAEQNPEIAQSVQALKNRQLADHVIQLLIAGQVDIVKTILLSLKEDAFDESLIDVDADIAEVLED